ncbi:MAG: hypothetical protein GX220_01160 [Treponema sp.]|nr:hypothetical protein [Treponema sp.]
MDMSETENYTFLTDLLTAIEIKTQWYDNVELPRLLTEYRDLQSYVQNLAKILLKKGSILEDPYKHDKKISDIAIPDETPFADNERSLIIGSRLSDYDSMLDFISNYMKFSVSSINVDKIKKLLALNNSFQWTAMVPTSSRPNTRGLAEMLHSIRLGSDTISVSIINDSLSHASKSLTTINGILKELTDFQKEAYKANVRKNILVMPDYPGNHGGSPDDAVIFIRKHFPTAMRKTSYYSELIEEIIQEDFSSEKETLRQAILNKMAVKQEVVKKKERKINTKNYLMDAIRTLASIYPQLEQISAKIEENKKLLDSEHNSFWDKFKALMRKAFNKSEPPVIYKITISESMTQTQRVESLDYHEFATNLVKRTRYYASLTIKNSPNYQKIKTLQDEKILEFLTKHLSECQRLLITLNALDEYFKNTPMPLNRVKVKGIKMEITTVKNILIKSNQRKAEYSAFVDEQNQLKKLGITNV